MRQLYRHILLLVFTLSIISLILSPSPLVAQSSTDPVKEKRSLSDSGLAREASSAAIGYLDKRGLDMDLQVYIVYKYLERKFEISSISDDNLYQANLKAKARQFPKTKAFLRLLSPKMGISKRELKKSNDPIDEMTSKALYCDFLDLDSAYLNQIKQSAARGGYSLPHAALSIQWLKENQCFADTGPVYRGVKDTIAKHLVLAVDTASGLKDGEIECIAMLYYIGKGSLVQGHWIRLLMSQQLEDGGWPEKPSRSDALGHTTVLALWVLLEHLHPEKNGIAWIDSER